MASSTQSSWPRCKASQAAWLVSSRRNNLRLGHSRRRRGSIAGSRKGAMVGMTPMRSSPVSGWPSARARSASSSLSRRMRSALSEIFCPSGVKRTTRRVRSTKVTPSKVSSSRRPADKVDWVTKQDSAALPKWPCRRSATRYCNCLSVGRWTVIGKSDEFNRYNRLERKSDESSQYNRHERLRPPSGRNPARVHFQAISAIRQRPTCRFLLISIHDFPMGAAFLPR